MRYFAVLVILQAMPVMASEAKLWKTVGDWSIHIQSDNASRCFASRSLDDGIEVQIGTEPTLDGGYFAIYNPAWTEIKDGDEGEVEFDFGVSRFGGAAAGRVENGVPGGYVFFNNPAFVQEFSRRQTVKVTGKRGVEFEMDLTGTSRAIRAVLACQDEQPEAATAD